MFKMIDMVNFDSDSQRYQEIDGIAEELDVSTHEVMMMNYLYELDAWCTSLVARMSNGTLMMARNLDFYFPDEMRKILYIGRFYRGDVFAFEATMFAGMVDVYTAIKPKAFALTVNERTAKTDRINQI